MVRSMPIPNDTYVRFSLRVSVPMRVPPENLRSRAPWSKFRCDTPRVTASDLLLRYPLEFALGFPQIVYCPEYELSSNSEDSFGSHVVALGSEALNLWDSPYRPIAPGLCSADSASTSVVLAPPRAVALAEFGCREKSPAGPAAPAVCAMSMQRTVRDAMNSCESLWVIGLSPFVL